MCVGIRSLSSRHTWDAGGCGSDVVRLPWDFSASVGRDDTVTIFG